MKLTLEDIARISGYSRSTVSRVVNGDENVSLDTREKVEQVIAEMNFQPNLAARSLATGQTHILGLIVPMTVNSIFSDPFYPILIQSISSTCNQKDYSIMLWLAEPEMERRMITRVLNNGLLDGVIVSALSLTDPIVQSLKENRLPYVSIGRHPLDDEGNYVDVDNYNGALKAINHLAALGRKRIATITGPMNVIVGVDRLRGYKDALTANGLPYDPDLVVEGDFSDSGGYAAMKKLLPHKPDAVFATSDVMAVAAVRVLIEANLKIPEDVAVIGFDDIPLASRTIPALTTISQPIVEMGMSVVELLIDKITHPSRPARQVIMPTHLVLRASCGSEVPVKQIAGNNGFNGA
jgi:LacI family transcriptional regulator